MRLVRDSTVLTWRAVAKDRFRLPLQQSTAGPSAILVGGSETADFEFAPDAPEELKLEVTRPDKFVSHVPVRLRVVAK
ncbi:MAG TPA: hypothetical protein VJ825_02670 [Gemmatimonadaceae bacterium]|nr:hypothetical protein [Gemmatimonadaceae bacterium]